MQPRRLYFVTGKGGVGKTVTSLALCLRLKQLGKKVYYNSFDQEPNWAILRALEIPTKYFTVEESAEIYVGNKLGSRTIGGWVMKAPFFSALYHMMPSLTSMILLGHIIKENEIEPDATIVVDSPASGHAKVIFESTQNLREMFGTGLIVEDIKKMQEFMTTPGNMRTLICALPGELPLEEGKELLDYLKKIGNKDTLLFLNDSLNAWCLDHPNGAKELPPILEERIVYEKNLVNSFSQDISATIPKIPELEQLNLIKNLATKMEPLIS